MTVLRTVAIELGSVVTHLLRCPTGLRRPSLLPARVKLHQHLPDCTSGPQYVAQDLIFCPLDVHLEHVDLRVTQHFNE